MAGRVTRSDAIQRESVPSDCRHAIEVVGRCCALAVRALEPNLRATREHRVMYFKLRGLRARRGFRHFFSGAGPYPPP
jgi:hypothetical protein